MIEQVHAKLINQNAKNANVEVFKHPSNGRVEVRISVDKYDVNTGEKTSQLEYYFSTEELYTLKEQLETELAAVSKLIQKSEAK